MRYAVPAPAFGVGLEYLSHSEEQHDEDGFGKLGLRSGQEADAEGPDGGYGHQEVLVEHISVRDALGRFLQRRCSDQQVRYQIDEKQLPCRQGAVLFYDYRPGQQDCCDGDKDDAPPHAPAFMSGLPGVMMSVIMMCVCHDSVILVSDTKLQRTGCNQVS